MSASHCGLRPAGEARGRRMYYLRLPRTSTPPREVSMPAWLYRGVMTLPHALTPATTARFGRFGGLGCSAAQSKYCVIAST